jgi:integrase
LDLATGLRCSELFALKWCDVLWDDLSLLVRRGIVTGIVSDVKTKYSNAGMPLDTHREIEKRSSTVWI